MYLEEVHIRNIKSIEEFEIDLQGKPGWNVILGDNGAGKSTILKCISIALLGEKQSFALDQKYKSWVKQGKNKGGCNLTIRLHPKLDQINNINTDKIQQKVNIELSGNIFGSTKSVVNGKATSKELSIQYDSKGFFSAAFGSYRRIGNKYSRNSSDFFDGKVGAHVAVFRDDFTLGSAIEWLQNLQFRSHEKSLDENSLKNIIKFFNSTGMLPDGVKIKEINAEGVYFNDSGNHRIDIFEMSDGYKSVFGLTIEIIRQMVLQYGFDRVFSSHIIKSGRFDLPGIILIDEVDVHLHPTWQSKIGNWFKKYFPKLQFIVTTHSPIICRASEGASIWKMEHPNSIEKSRKLKGTEFNRLVYGDILEAFGTEVFGENVTRSAQASEKLNEMAKLNMLKTMGKLDVRGKSKLKNLKQTFTSDDSFEF